MMFWHINICMKHATELRMSELFNLANMYLHGVQKAKLNITDIHHHLFRGLYTCFAPEASVVNVG
jgi:hypothetical protein